MLPQAATVFLMRFSLTQIVTDVIIKMKTEIVNNPSYELRIIKGAMFMTVQQQAHVMIDKQNVNGLNYIINVLNELDSDNWIDQSSKKKIDSIHSNEKKEAFQRLEERRKKYESFDIEDFETAKAEGILEKWGNIQ